MVGKVTKQRDFSGKLHVSDGFLTLIADGHRTVPVACGFRFHSSRCLPVASFVGHSYDSVISFFASPLQLLSLWDDTDRGSVMPWCRLKIYLGHCAFNFDLEPVPAPTETSPIVVIKSYRSLSPKSFNCSLSKQLNCSLFSSLAIYYRVFRLHL